MEISAKIQKEHKREEARNTWINLNRSPLLLADKISKTQVTRPSTVE